MTGKPVHGAELAARDRLPACGPHFRWTTQSVIGQRKGSASLTAQHRALKLRKPTLSFACTHRKSCDAGLTSGRI